jgi:hypothetical protein
MSFSGTSTPNEHIAPFTNAKEAKKQNKNLWSSLKHAVVEHHRSVNRAYQVCYGAGLNGAPRKE